MSGAYIAVCAFITRCLRARAPQDWGSQGAISLPVQEGTSDRTLLEASFGRTRHGPGGRHELRLFESRGQNLPDKLQNAVRAFFKMPECTISPIAPARSEQNTYCAVGEAKRYCCRHLC